MRIIHSVSQTRNHVVDDLRLADRPVRRPRQPIADRPPRDFHVGKTLWLADFTIISVCALLDFGLLVTEFKFNYQYSFSNS